jgi:hypothetical protein
LLIVVGLVAVAPATALAAKGGSTMFVHSAKSGELQGGRLTLRGVSRRVTWVTNGGRSGVVSVVRLHHKLFATGTPPATGTLHVAGFRGGDEPAFSLSRPRYNASRHTVSYAAKPLNHRALPGHAARAAQGGSAQRFGAASLSLVGAPPVNGVGDNGGNDCSSTLTNETPFLFEASGESKWDTDTWDPGIPFQYQLDGDGSVITWQSDGGLWRGCSNWGSWTVVPDPYNQNPPSATVVVSTTYQWNGSFSNTCTSSNPNFTCQQGNNDGGNASWTVNWHS